MIFEHAIATGKKPCRHKAQKLAAVLAADLIGYSRFAGAAGNKTRNVDQVH
jgi:hypothetical protein